MAQTSPAHLQGPAPVQDGLLTVRIDRERLHSLGGRDVLGDVRVAMPVGVGEVVGVADRGLSQLDVALSRGCFIVVSGVLVCGRISIEGEKTEESEG